MLIVEMARKIQVFNSLWFLMKYHSVLTGQRCGEPF